MATPAELIGQVRKTLEKKYKDSTELFPDLTSAKEIEVVPSPSAVINAVTGVGGFPKARVTEIYGPLSSGKTTIAIEVCVAAQQADPEARCLYVDYEHAFDARYAHALDLNLDPTKFIFAQPEYFEQGAQIIDKFLDEGIVDIVVIDSAAAMTPRSEFEGEMDQEGGTQKGTQSALMAKFLSVVTKKLNRGRKPPLIIINQTRANIVIGGNPAQNKHLPKEKPAGGNALKFYTSIRLELAVVKFEGESERGSKGTDQVYTRTRIRVTAVKNKVAPPFIRGQIVIDFGTGINNIESIASLAEAKLGIMSASGGFIKYEGDTTATSFSCRGRDAFRDKLKSDPDVCKEIELKVLEAIKQEHAKALGIGSIKVKGKAKTIEAEAGTLVLDSGEGSKKLNGPGLPTEEA